MIDLASLTEKFLDRFRTQGAAVTPEAFADEYPEYRDALLDVLPALIAMEEYKRRTNVGVLPVKWPQRLGEYTLLEKIGQGGMGTVFRARQETLDREVAVKILTRLLSSDESQRLKFENESRIVAGLHHTNVVSVFGAGHDGDESFYVMELIDNVGLSPDSLRRVKPGVPYFRAVADVGLQASDGLAYAHARGVLHRDIKPSNMLLDGRGQIHLSDFGLARCLNEVPGTTLSQTQSGTLRYMAPERLLRGESGYKSDQYALGLTLYELLKEHPVTQDAVPGAIVKTICEGGIAPLDRTYGELGAIVNKSMSYLPSDRYEDVAAMADDLRRYLNGEPVQAKRPSLVKRARFWMRRNPVVSALVFLSVCLFGLLFVSIAYGYIRTQDALAREKQQRISAETNLRLADTSLERVFERFSKRNDPDNFFPFTELDSRLLADLIPWYEQVAELGNAPRDRIAKARYILGTITLGTENLTLAEKSFRAACETPGISERERTLYRIGLAQALFRNDKNDEAFQLANRLAGEMAEDLRFDQRCEAIRLYRLAVNARFPNKKILTEEQTREKNDILTKEATLLRKLLDEYPDDDRCIVFQALILNESPELAAILKPTGIYADPLATMMQMAAKYPRRLWYKTNLIAIAQKIPLNGPESQADADRIKQVLNLAEQLVLRYYHHARTISGYFTLWNKYLNYLQKQGETARALEECERLNTGLGIVCAATDNFDPIRTRRANVMLDEAVLRTSTGDLKRADELSRELEQFVKTCDPEDRLVLERKMKKLPAPK